MNLNSSTCGPINSGTINDYTKKIPRLVLERIFIVEIIFNLLKYN